MISRTAAKAATLAAMLSLAACQDDPAPVATSDPDAGAKGEIQGGTISDAMLPLDTLESQSPPRGGSGSGTDDGDESTDETAE